MRILIIDNNIDPDSWGARDLRNAVGASGGATIYVRRAPQNDLPEDPSAYDRIIVSGSKTSALEDAPWISKLHQFIRKSIDLKKPFLGVCFGHQALARALGSKENVRKSKIPEFGWTEIEILSESLLTKNLPKTFYTYSSHFEEVSELLPEMKPLARSKDCEIQSLELKGYPVFGIQFHPEKTLEEASKSLRERKKTKQPKNLLHPDEGEKYYDPTVCKILFENFLKL